MSRFVVLAALLVAVATAMTPDMFPERLRGGGIYRRAMLQHTLHSAKRGLSSNTTVNWFDQLKDHSDSSQGTFKQKYWMDLGNYSGAPKKTALIYINGEGPASQSPGGYIQELAYSMGSAIFTIEHRYYGASLPSKLTDKAQFMKLLTVENALADLIYFIEYAEKTYLNASEAPVTWYVAGGSYSGALSSWLREKYPNKIVASWSSSGVINAIFNFDDFDGSIVNVIPPVCSDAIRTVYEMISAAYDKDKAALLQKLNTPAYFTKQDVAWMIADGAAMMVQYGSKDVLCNQIVPLQEDPIQQYADMIHEAWGEHFTANCYYSTECLSNTTYADQWGPGGYSWVYQCCSQLAYWQPGYPGSLRLRVITTDYFISQCRSAFTPDILPDTFAFNRKFGGLKSNATKVVATQGSDDPWQWAGAMESLGPEYPEVLAQCDGCGHCGDMATPFPFDPESLTQQRRAVAQYMTKWVSEAAKGAN